MTNRAASILHRWLSTPLVAEVLSDRAERVPEHAVTPSRTWLGYLDGDTTARKVGAHLAGTPITRRMLGDAGSAAGEATGDARDALLVAAFVTCQMWGGAGSGRVMANTRTALAGPVRTRHILREFAEAVAVDPVAAATANLTGWGWAFSTKLGYALTYPQATVTAGRPALIYDQYVVKSLGIPGAADHGGYRGYLEAVWTAAAQHQVRSDPVEHLLFSPKLDLRSWDLPTTA